MNYKYIILFLSFIFNQDFPQLGNDQSFDIATWNIENFPKNNNTIEYVQDIIETSNLDIIALQEISDLNEFNELINNLQGWEGFRYSDSDYGELAFLINLNNIQIIESPYSILNQHNHYFAYRPPYLTKVNFQNQEIVIINVHYKCCGDGILENDYWDEEYRRQQSNLLLKQYIDNNHDEDFVIVLGDFNDDIVENNQNNVFLNFINDDLDYYFIDTNIANGASSNWSFPNWPSHLDHILVTNEIFMNDMFNNNDTFTYKIDNYMNGWQQYDYYISDHRPVATNIYFSLDGDLNFDSNINILDITILIGLILNSEYLSNADLNQDEGLNILDVILMVDLIITN